MVDLGGRPPFGLGPQDGARLSGRGPRGGGAPERYVGPFEEVEAYVRQRLGEDPHVRAEALPAALDQATAPAQARTEFLAQLLAVEVDATEARRLAGRMRFSNFPAPWRLADFDFSAQPSIDAALSRDLATSRYTQDATNILFIGPPGVGKTMLASRPTEAPAPGETSSATPPSPPPCSTGSCTAAPSSTSPATATACEPTKPAPDNTQPLQLCSPGWGISLINSGEFR